MNKKYGLLLLCVLGSSFITAKKYKVYVDNQTKEPEKVTISGPVGGRGKKAQPLSLVIPAGTIGVFFNFNIRKPGNYLISSDKPGHYMTFAIDQGNIEELYGHVFYFKITPPHFQQVTYPFEQDALREKAREGLAETTAK
jgi:hypothetical protein